MTRLASRLALLSLTALVACDAPDSPATGTTGEVASAAAPPSPARITQAEALAPAPAHKSHAVVHRDIPQAKQVFEEVTALIENKYVDGPLSQDELWAAATEGVLSRLIQLEGHSVNTLLSPAELEELMEGTRGHIVGIGIAVEEVAGTLVVRELIEGGPAADSGLAPGDRVLGVDGKRLTGMPLRESVMLIRGEVGTSVELFVQRDTEEWTVEIERSRVEVRSVESRLFDDGRGYLRLNAFSKQTAAEVSQHLEALRDAGMTRLVLDLRMCPGGLLDSALEVAELFLAPGKRIVSIRGVKGDDDRDAEREDAWEMLPMVVLVGPKTASGAEILSGALGEHGRALVVGQQTLGKGTVEAIHELSNGWALKLSSARFFSPQGNPRQGEGVVPDVAVAGGETKPARVASLDPASDPALHAALELLEH